jgi:ArsR family transcriptional regulator, arsenate/arsenite/antimonite-responsive transcriptional repressor
LVDIFKALSEESRLRILALLIQREMCVCEIEICLKMTQSNASRHLTMLRKSGILESYKSAQWTYYRIDKKFIKEHKDLWNYLQLRLKEIPTFQLDSEECAKCNAMDVCK